MAFRNYVQLNALKDKQRADEKLRRKRLMTKAKRGLLHITHIPHGVCRHSLQQNCNLFGVVTKVMFWRALQNGKCRGYAFVEFLDFKAAKLAQRKLDRTIVLNKRIRAHYFGKISAETRGRDLSVILSKLRLTRLRLLSQKMRTCLIKHNLPV